MSMDTTDLEEFFRKRGPLKGGIPKMDFNFHPRSVLTLIVLFFIVVGAYTSFFTVSPEEVGVVLRFGRYIRTVDPGLNFKMPFGIEKVYKVPVERQMKEEFGFRTVRPARRTSYSKRDYSEESLMLTGDLNSADVEWIVQFRIKDPYKFLFKVRNNIDTFRDMNEAVMREVVGDRSVNEVLTVGRVEIETEVKRMLQELADQYELGIKVMQIVLQDVNPPEPVKPAFNEVNEAQQEKERMINEAQSEYNKVIPRARGEAKKVIEEAKGYAVERVNRAKGEAEKFNALFSEYLKAPEVTKQRIFLETMNEVLPRLGRKLITDKETAGILPLFQFGEPNLSGKGVKR
ncbi:MAG: FtsH protease activity modulator HflK [Nitrospirae bacterium]|nr:MAG: FtsH protease activity modulator HflK [Nitrospirota bacterium]